MFTCRHALILTKFYRRLCYKQSRGEQALSLITRAINIHTLCHLLGMTDHLWTFTEDNDDDHNHNLSLVCDIGNLNT